MRTLRARTHTHMQMPHRRSPSPTCTLARCCCQIKAGHKGKCAAAGTRTAAKQTVAWVYGTLGNAYQSLENVSRAIECHKEHVTMAKEVGNWAEEGKAYGNLGIAYRSLGSFSKAIEYHAQHLATAKEVGDRVGKGAAYPNLGNVFHSPGDYAKAIEYHTQDLTMAKEVGDCKGGGRLQRKWATGRGRARRTGTSSARIISRGPFPRPRVPRAAPGD